MRAGWVVDELLDSELSLYKCFYRARAAEVDRFIKHRCADPVNLSVTFFPTGETRSPATSADRSPLSYTLEKHRHGQGSNQLGIDRLLCAIADRPRNTQAGAIVKE
ncbi:hypothetical protein QUB56_29395 [Microcoleus sp. AR_TQ3_B6]|uniref:hypothetical protein n=1 Tax=Microcoleus sp. AR_TQ3_B6 TaxID=3055284 RepID=UPI002FD0ADFB